METIPENEVALLLILAGPAGSGKTTTALQIAANAQKEAYGSRDVWYINVEGRLNRKNLEGIKKTRFFLKH